MIGIWSSGDEASIGEWHPALNPLKSAPEVRRGPTPISLSLPSHVGHNLLRGSNRVSTSSQHGDWTVQTTAEDATRLFLGVASRKPKIPNVSYPRLRSGKPSWSQRLSPALATNLSAFRHRRFSLVNITEVVDIHKGSLSHHRTVF